MSEEQFHLRWNNHQPNFVNAFSSLLNTEALVDVTLAAEGKYIQTHKVVLSACSSYFQSLLTMNPCQHPIIILKDVNYEDLRAVVDFMYCGEVSITHDRLTNVLKTAETLQVKGLADMPEFIICDKTSGGSTPGKRKRFRGSGSSNESAAGGSISIEDVEILTPADQHHSQLRRSSGTSDCGIEVRTPKESRSQKINSILEWHDPSCGEAKCKALRRQKSDDSVSSRGSKRNRWLVRQERIKRDLDSDGVESDQNEEGNNSGRVIGRQYSDPTTGRSRTLSPPIQSAATGDSNLLTVPQTSSHLVKQNSDSAITTKEESKRIIRYSEKIAKMDKEQDIILLSNEVASLTPDARSNHCPALRPGPALSCTFCWNSIDANNRILRRKTKYHCPECQVNLCIVPCFQCYHEDKNYLIKDESTKTGKGGKRRGTSTAEKKASNESRCSQRHSISTDNVRVSSTPTVVKTSTI